ncbi:MAG: AAA family ATPase [Bifidobacteriaceae bacterium]|nr:AAA family ATPase [Bifidobacteriaceae bacterium]
MNDGHLESLLLDFYGTRVALDGFALTVTATNAMGRSALGVAAVRIPLSDILSVAMKQASLFTNGQIVIESRTSTTLVYFRRESRRDAGALVDALHAWRMRIPCSSPISPLVPPPAAAAIPSEPETTPIVQVQYLSDNGMLLGSDGQLPVWAAELSPSSDCHGYTYSWRPASPPMIGSLGIDDLGRNVAVVGFGRKGYDGPLRQIITHLPGTVFDQVAAYSAESRASVPMADHAAPARHMGDATTQAIRPIADQPGDRSWIELTDEFKSAMEILESGGSMFLTGKAGTGKSTLVRHFVENTRRKVVVAAPTGIAALNVDGLTVHRLFGFTANTTLDTVASGDYRPNRFAKVIAGMDTLIIDEASMVRADLLDQVEIAMRRFGPRKGQPFGGVQVILVGDLFQLPPVVPDSEKSWLESRYDTPYFFSAASFTRKHFRTVSLSKVFRQIGDDQLTGLLNAVREGVLVDEMRNALNTRVRADFAPPDDEFWLRVAPTNRIVNARNVQALERLPGAVYHHEAVTSGDISGFDKPVENEVIFKTGAQIMLLNNDAAERWVNGSIGRITRVWEGGGRVDVMLNDGSLVEVRPHTWEVTEPRYSAGKMTRVTVGTFTQLPFKLAWAVTIHKCQGLTLDRLIVDLTGGTFAFGQTYVALSRCTSMDGLVLSKPLLPSHLKTDRRVARFLADATSANSHAKHVAIAVLTVGADDARSKPRPVEIALAFEDGTAISTLVNPERDLSGARELYGISMDEIALAPTLSEAWSVLARVASGAIPVGVDIDRTTGYLDWELKRLGMVLPLPLGIAVDPEAATPSERADLCAGSALRRASAALRIFQRRGGTGGTSFGTPNGDHAATYLLSRDEWTTSPVGSVLGNVLSLSQIISSALIRGQVIAGEQVRADEMIRQALAARVESVAKKSAGLSPTLLGRLQFLRPVLGDEVADGLVHAGGVDPSAVVFRGARVCFTGDATDARGHHMTRSEIEAYARSVGLVPVGSVTKTRCDFLVVAEHGTQSGKARKAAEYGKPVITVEQFLSTEPSAPTPINRSNPANAAPA